MKLIPVFIIAIPNYGISLVVFFVDLYFLTLTSKSKENIGKAIALLSSDSSPTGTCFDEIRYTQALDYASELGEITYQNEQYIEFNMTIDNIRYAVTLNRETEGNSTILSSKILNCVENNWINQLYEWADRYDIEDYNIPRNVTKLINLTHLSFESISYFERDKISKLPKGIGKLTKLKFLELGNLIHPEILLNCLEKLPKEIGDLTELTHLYIQFNNLTELPSEIGNLTQLKDLKLGGNNLEKLPSQIGNLKNLEILTIWNNKLTTLPPEIGSLTKLKGLSFWGNSLTDLPEEIVNLTELKVLELDKTIQLSDIQNKWIITLKQNGCEVQIFS